MEDGVLSSGHGGVDKLCLRLTGGTRALPFVVTAFRRQRTQTRTSPSTTQDLPAASAAGDRLATPGSVAADRCPRQRTDRRHWAAGSRERVMRSRMVVLSRARPALAMHHRRAPGVHRGDDLLRRDSLQVGRRCRQDRDSNHARPHPGQAAATRDSSARGEPLVRVVGASGVLSGRSSRSLRSEQRVKALAAEERIGGSAVVPQARDRGPRPGSYSRRTSAARTGDLLQPCGGVVLICGSA
jgi:hypothetical protein